MIRNQIFRIVNIGILFLSVHSLALPPEVGELTWSDEFEGTELDTTKWSTMEGSRKGGYMDPNDVYLDGEGNLVMRVSHHPDDTYNWHHGFIRTVKDWSNSDESNLFMQKYGYFEIRCVLPKNKGPYWAAFWTMDYDMVDGGTGAEVDIMEYFYNDMTYHPVVHWGGYNNTVSNKAPLDYNIKGTKHDYHTFGLLWTPEKYIWYCDEEPVWEFNEKVSHWPAYLKLTIEVSTPNGWLTNSEGQMNPASLPDYWVVDYCRAYKLRDSVALNSNQHITPETHQVTLNKESVILNMSKAATYTLRLISPKGQVVQELPRVALKQGNNEITLKDNLARGVYVLHILGLNFSSSHKLSIE